MSGINECSELVQIRTDELSGQIGNLYNDLVKKMDELDIKNKNDRRELIMGDISNENYSKIKKILLLNMVLCILVLILLIKSFMV